LWKTPNIVTKVTTQEFIKREYIIYYSILLAVIINCSI
jgi:hypothetical protein